MFNQMSAELLNAFGESATYTPQGGNAQKITALFETSAEQFGGGFDSHYPDSEATATFLTSEIANPARGDAITDSNGTAYSLTEIITHDTGLIVAAIREV